MVIEFLCPKGHKIRCREERAGQAARCPKCGVKFIIPDATPENQAPDPVPPTSLSGTSSGSGVRSGAGDSKDLIEFLCPNGHLLHGSKRLQGHPGQCPECGSKFRIPTYEEPFDEQETAGDKVRPGSAAPEPRRSETPAKEPEIQVSLEPLRARDDSAINLSDVHNGLEGSGTPGSGSLAAAARLRTALQSNGSDRLKRAKEAHPFYDLFQRLWTTKTDAAVVELRLASGETLIPFRFHAAMSQGSHAVFAVKEPDNTYTLVAAAWDSISHVSVRGLTELPEEMRE